MTSWYPISSRYVILKTYDVSCDLWGVHHLITPLRSNYWGNPSPGATFHCCSKTFCPTGVVCQIWDMNLAWKPWPWNILLEECHQAKSWILFWMNFLSIKCLYTHTNSYLTLPPVPMSSKSIWSRSEKILFLNVRDNSGSITSSQIKTKDKHHSSRKNLIYFVICPTAVTFP